ncbi:MAG: hypothetical protein LBE91_03535 [Tannerella sp.]|jgi:hypothetical protein|nr:hypothetical protein [Tannerella sp.]
MNNYNEFQAKPYFEYLLKEYLYPLFQEKGYKKKGTYHWIRLNGEIQIDIKLKKSVYNTKRRINFSLCIGLSDMEGNLSFYGWQNDEFLPQARVAYKRENHHWNGWYLIFRANEFDKLLNDELKIDLEDYIFPLLKKINSKEILSHIVSKGKEKNGNLWYIPDEIKFE